MSKAREEKRIYDKAYHIRNREKRKIQSSVYYITHKEQIEAYRDANRERRCANRKAYRTTHKNQERESQRTYNLLRKYGLSREAFAALLHNQGNVCAICKKPNWNGTKPYVDHDHVTGKVRNILCGKCNLVLGMINDDPKILQAMTNYLYRFNEAAINP